jgi:hypothetical protein
MVFKNRNHFTEIKDFFSVKPKIFFVVLNTENIFQKSFYAESNGTLMRIMKIEATPEVNHPLP